MKRVVLALALALPGAVLATQLTARQGNDRVTITDRPCVNEKVIAVGVSLGVPKFVMEASREATAVLNGKTYVACWQLGGDKVALIFEDGDGGLVSIQLFKPESEI